MKIRIGTRGSDLALWQATHVAALLGRHGVSSDIIVLKTRGDLIDDVPLTQVEGKAFFTAEIERALLQNEVDLAVHSHKDLPTEATPGLVIAAVPARGPQIERLLIAPKAHDPKAAFLPLVHGARVGTSAPRRGEQLLSLRPDLQVLDLRGNVPTRVRKLREGRYDAVVLAAAGLDRLRLDVAGLVAVDLPPELFVPAPAQGALAIQVRAADSDILALCRRHLHDEATARAVGAERTLLVRTGGGCNLPLAAAVLPDASGVIVHGFLGKGHPAGAKHARWVVVTGPDPDTAAATAIEELMQGRTTRRGPLAGLRVALTGTAADGSYLEERLSTLGAEPLPERVIDVVPVAGVDVARAVAALRPGDVLAVTSRQTARFLEGCRVPEGVTIAAVGRATARALGEIGLAPAVTGEGGGAKLAETLAVTKDTRVLWLCAAEAQPDLGEALQARGARVERLVVYETKRCLGVTLHERVDARVYMSPSAVQAALDWERMHVASRTKRFALGHTTLAELERHRLAAVAPSCQTGPVTEELIHELWRHFAQGRNVDAASRRVEDQP
jgi:hydroxymethylbilane synthase